MKTCGECAWYAKEDEEWGDCSVPVPQSLYDMDKRPIHPSDNASSCVCFKARVCEVCGNCGWTPENVPCPACHGKEEKE